MTSIDTRVTNGRRVRLRKIKSSYLTTAPQGYHGPSVFTRLTFEDGDGQDIAGEPLQFPAGGYWVESRSGRCFAISEAAAFEFFEGVNLSAIDEPDPPAAGCETDEGFLSTLERELAGLLNRFCVENESNTPDFILAKFLLNALAGWRVGIRSREQWYGVHHSPGEGGERIERVPSFVAVPVGATGFDVRLKPLPNDAARDLRQGSWDWLDQVEKNHQYLATCKEAWPMLDTRFVHALKDVPQLIAEIRKLRADCGVGTISDATERLPGPLGRDVDIHSQTRDR